MFTESAKFLKSRIGNSSLVLAELCNSIGITLEYLVPDFKKVIGVDLDKNILEMSKTNLKESGFIDKTELIHGDVFDDNVLKNIEADIVINDIPFWYPYKLKKNVDLIDRNPPLRELVAKIQRNITSKIIIFSPPEWDYESFEK